MYDDERTDPYCISDAEADRLLAGAPWRRFAVLGDSIAEGLGEPRPGYAADPWADRVAAALRRQQPDLAYVNLGRRNLRAAEVRLSQLGHALAFGPDLAAVVCGGNDLFAGEFDGDAVEAELDALVGTLVRAGSDVVTFTMLDVTKALPVPGLTERLAALAERTTAVARRYGTVHVEMAGHPAAAETASYASDRMHASARGHAVVAAATIRGLGERIARLARTGRG